MQTTNVALEEALTYLTRATHANLYAYIINAFERVPVPGLGTFGICAHGNRFALMYDPEFIKSIPFDELVATCEHEVVHGILGHVARGMRLYRLAQDDDQRRLLMMASPIAVDAAANELLRMTTPKIADPDKPLGYWVLAENHDLPRDGSFEQYLEILVQRFAKDQDRAQRVQQRALELAKDALRASAKALPPDPQSPYEQLKMGGGGGDEDGESDEGGSGGEDGENAGEEEKSGGGALADPKEEAEAQAIAEGLKHHAPNLMGDYADGARPNALEDSARAAVRKAVAAYKKNHGSIPGHLEEIIRKFLAPPMVPWHLLYENKVSTLLSSRPRRSMQRISVLKAALGRFYGKEHPFTRRLSYFPGTSRDRKFRVYFVVDTSGSMQNKHIGQGLAQLYNLLASGVDIEIVVLYVDTQVAKAYTLEPGDEIDYTACGRGGTTFETAFAYIAEKMKRGEEIHLLTYVTDGYAPPPKTVLPIPCIWIITEGGKPIMPGVPGHTTFETKDYPSGAYE